MGTITQRRTDRVFAIICMFAIWRNVAALKIQKRGSCGAYNLGTGRESSVLELIAEFEKATGEKALGPRRAILLRFSLIRLRLRKRLGGEQVAQWARHPRCLELG